MHSDAWPLSSATADIVQRFSAGALAVQIWEFFSSLTSEVEYLSSDGLSLVKCLYIWSRYVLFVVQVIVHGPRIPQLCVAANIHRTVSGQIAISALETILVVRVYAFYTGHKSARRFLKVLFVVGFVLQVIGNAYIIRHLLAAFSCHIPDISSGLLYFGAGAGLNQSTIIILTTAKYVVGYRQGWARTPLVFVMIRDGAVVFLILSVILGVIISNELLERLSLAFWHTAFSWYITLLSIAGCRLVLNMRQIANEANATAVASPQLTSINVTQSSSALLSLTSTTR
ncbi:hypothetical protein BDN72DRAFT_89317 [Pluteus cervinus]|uniref:Uncharacterized protein n=1 Tax=Pluteus cervinus TaxID=181527 RepID=A0ACD3API3_9AGAR|nr:hypothetical protein BDN72DRAFT_89317 [Pluteus cervinus]